MLILGTVKRPRDLRHPAIDYVMFNRSLNQSTLPIQTKAARLGASRVTRDVHVAELANKEERALPVVAPVRRVVIAPTARLSQAHLALIFSDAVTRSGEKWCSTSFQKASIGLGARLGRVPSKISSCHQWGRLKLTVGTIRTISWSRPESENREWQFRRRAISTWGRLSRRFGAARRRAVPLQA